MGDSYQPIYDAVRSRISGGNIGDAVSMAAREALDISFLVSHAQQEVYSVSASMTRPSVLYRPRLAADGDMWCALLGDDLQSGVAGFGRTPAEAMRNFDLAFEHEQTPTAIRLARAKEAVSA